MVSRRATVVTSALVLLGVLAVAMIFATNKGGAQPAGQDAIKFEKVKKPAVAPLADFFQGEPKKPAAPKKPLLILEERVDMDKFQGPMTLKEALEVLHKDLAGRGMELDISVDGDAFKDQNPDAPDIFETMVSLPQLPRKLTVTRLLRHLLTRVPTRDAGYVVYNDHILITTADRTSTDALLLQKVTGVYDNRPLAEVLRDLAEKKGTTIVLDRRVAEKDQRPISVTFQSSTTLAGALRVIAEMADLKVLVLDGIVLVTTPAHAEQLRKEQKLQEKDGYLMWPSSQFLEPRQILPDTLPSAPVNPGLPGVPGTPGFPGLGGFPGAPGIPIVDPRPMPTPPDATAPIRKAKEAA